MKKTMIPAYITGLPQEPIKFSEDSIIIEDNGVEFLIGQAAAERDPEASRRFHGTFKRPQYRRLVMGLLARLLGEGEHSIDLALCAPRPAMEGFRKGASSMDLADDQWEILVSSIGEIKFREDSSESPLKVCRITPTKGQIFYETQAVKEAIPSQLKSFVLWQMGHGDLQQITFIDHKVKSDTHAHVEGISGAIKIFAKLTGHAMADAEDGWRTERLSRPGGMNGDSFTRDEILNLKKRALREYFGTQAPKLLNLNEKYKLRAKNIILAGGGAKDYLAVEVLKEEVEAEGYYQLHTIDKLPVKDERCDDPSFATVMGMLNHATVAIDPGNSFLKGGVQ